MYNYSKQSMGLGLGKGHFFERKQPLLFSCHEINIHFSCLLLSSLGIDFDESNQKVIFGIDNSSRLIIKLDGSSKLYQPFC